jgi:hypothetical protein
MNNSKSTNLNIKAIALDEIITQSGYQRPISSTQVEKITSSFDENLLGVLTVSYRDGSYHIIDGACRVHVMRNLGYTHAYAVILTGLTYSQEAKLFIELNNKNGQFGTQKILNLPTLEQMPLTIA